MTTEYEKAKIAALEELTKAREYAKIEFPDNPTAHSQFVMGWMVQTLTGAYTSKAALHRELSELREEVTVLREEVAGLRRGDDFDAEES